MHQNVREQKIKTTWRNWRPSLHQLQRDPGRPFQMKLTPFWLMIKLKKQMTEKVWDSQKFTWQRFCVFSIKGVYNKLSAKKLSNTMLVNESLRENTQPYDVNVWMSRDLKRCSCPKGVKLKLTHDRRMCFVSSVGFWHLVVFQAFCLAVHGQFPACLCHGHQKYLKRKTKQVNYVHAFWKPWRQCLTW